MEFNGAVLVTNQKIENALENYKLLKEEYTSEVARCQEKLASQIGDLTWWDNFMCSSESKDWERVFIRKYKGYISTYFRDYYLLKFCKAGLVTEDVYKKLENLDFNVVYYNKDASSIKHLVQAGSPVYLNPEQANFVNTFYKSIDTSD